MTTPAAFGRHHAWLGSVLSQGLVRGLTLATALVVARLLGPAGRGNVEAITLVPITVLATGSFVSISSVAYFCATGGDAKIRASLGIAATLAVVLVLAHSMLIRFWAQALDVAAFRGLEWFGAVYIPLTLAGVVASGALIAEGKLATLWTARLLGAFATLAVVGLGFLSGGHATVSEVLLAYAAGPALLAAWAWQAQQSVTWRLLQCTPSRSDYASVLRYGRDLLFTSIPAQLHLRVDKFLIASQLGMLSLGVYSASVSWSSIVYVVGAGLGPLVLSSNVRAVSRQAGRAEVLAQRARRAALLVLAAAMCVAVAAPLGIRVVYGDRFESATIPAILLSLGSGLVAWKGLLHEYARGHGNPSAGARAEVAGLMTAVIVLAIALRPLGMLGACLASLCSNAVVVGWFMRDLKLRGLVGSVSELCPGVNELRFVMRSGWIVLRRRNADRH